jgi:hypothetical protein
MARHRRTANSGVRYRHLNTNSLLERLSVQLSLKGSKLEFTGTTVKRAVVRDHVYDTVLALVHAGEQEPVGWIIFMAKYMHDECALSILRNYLLMGLENNHLADIALLWFCEGEKKSARELRRDLDLTRVQSTSHRRRITGMVDRLLVVEEAFATYVRRAL